MGVRDNQSSSSVVIKKPALDPKTYRYLQLDNGLKVLLINDPKAQKASASLDVNVGSGADPKDREGLAHFLEHMLFLGTKKYPKANEYQAFIQRHGGSYNAYTSYDHTNYFFDIQSDQFNAAFDRFAQFFIEPLFLSELIERERKAVFSEYAARIKDEGRRSLDAFKAAINQDHPFAKFSVGADETLRSHNLREDVIQFYQSHYSSDVMSLVVSANQSLDSLEQLVTEAFSKVERKSLSIKSPSIKKHLNVQEVIKLFEPESLPALLQIKPEKTLRRLSLSFPIESTKPYYQSKPLSYIAHILGHEGKGSLLSELKRLNLASYISAGTGHIFKHEATFVVSIGLTEKGEKGWEKVTELVFSAIKRIQSEPLNPKLYQDLAKISELEYRFKDANTSLNHIIHYATNLHDYAAEDVIAGPYLYESYRPDLIHQFLSRLNPQNVLITLTSKQVEATKVTKWFHAPYQFSSLSDQWVNQLSNISVHPNILIPENNPFLPSDLTVNKAPDNSLSIPKLMINNDGVRFWYKQDETFLKPKTQWVMSLNANSVGESALSYAANILQAEMLSDAINELAYPALMAGLRFSISAHKRGLSIRLSGYDDKQSLLFNRLIHVVDKGVNNQDRFAALKSDLIHYYRNQAQNKPYQSLMRSVTNRLVSPSYEPDVIAKALEQLTWTSFKTFHQIFWQDYEIEGLAHGNMNPDRAKTIFIDAIQPLKKKRQNNISSVSPVVIKSLEDSSSTIKINSKHKDHAVVVYYQFPKGVEALAASSISAKLIETRFYSELRTSKQLGYVVFATPYILKDQAGLAFVVQSPSALPESLVEHINQFIDDFIATHLANDASREALKKEFLDAKKALRHELKIPAKNLREQTSRYWSDINNQKWQFDSRQKTVDALEVMSFEQWYSEFIKAIKTFPKVIYASTSH